MRRGLTGSITYGLTDATGIAAFYVAAATQILIYAALTGLVLFILSRIKMTGPMAILAISPVFLPMPFFFSKLGISKDMIGFLAIALVTSPPSRPRNGRFGPGQAALPRRPLRIRSTQSLRRSFWLCCLSWR